VILAVEINVLFQKIKIRKAGYKKFKPPHDAGIIQALVSE
jgi:hypothetical protein